MAKTLKPRRYTIPIHFGFYPMWNPLKFPHKLQELLEQEGLGHLFYLLENGDILEMCLIIFVDAILISFFFFTNEKTGTSLQDGLKFDSQP